MYDFDAHIGEKPCAPRCVPFWERFPCCACDSARTYIQFFPFTALKRDQRTGAPLPGAVFTLTGEGRVIATAVSDENGRLIFPNLAPGSYELTESAPPSGYTADPARHRVIVHSDGRVTVDGIPADDFALYDAPVTAEVSFQKTDAAGAPLEGALFALSGGMTAASNESGTVNLGALAPGTYTLTEQAAPAGYRADPTPHTVTVADDGTVTVDGAPLAEFSVVNLQATPSQRPVITSVTEGDTLITGSGVPGAEIVVTLSDGTLLTTTVDVTGRWQVPVPEGTVLRAGDTLYARQTQPGLAPSEQASFLVQPAAR